MQQIGVKTEQMPVQQISEKTHSHRCNDSAKNRTEKDATNRRKSPEREQHFINKKVLIILLKLRMQSMKYQLDTFTHVLGWL